MASSGDEVRVSIGVPVETNASAAADDVAALRDSIARSKDVIREASENLRHLRGNTDAIKRAKDQLKQARDREKDAISQATLKLIKHGTTFDKVARQQRDQAKAQDALKKKTADALKAQSTERVKAFGDAITKAGGPLAAFRDKLSAVGELASKGGGLGLMTLAAAGLTAALVALVAASAAGIVALARWALRGADAARSMQLLREATTTSTLSATNLGTQVDALAKKVPTSTDALNQLGASIAKMRLGGQQSVDLLNAVAQANAALGDETAGSKLKEIVERGRLAQRMYLGLYELQGTGLDFDDVAGALAESMHVGVAKARQALMTGQVSLSAGAEALRKATEKKFGNINLRKMMSFDGLAETARKFGQSLTKDINLEPASQAAFKFLHAFDESTATGAVLKRVVTVFGNGVVNVLERGAPIAKEFLRGMIIGGLELYIGYLRVRNAFRDALKVFGDSDLLSNVDAMTIALESGKVVIGTIAIALGVAAAAVLVVGGTIAGAVLAFEELTDAGLRFGTWIRETNWTSLGSNVVDGLVDGLKSGAGKLGQAVTELADKMKKGFTGALGIKSPSKVFEGFGRNTTAGFQRGVEKTTPAAQRAVEAMGAPPMPAPGSAMARGAGGAAGAPTAIIHVTNTFQGGAGAPSPKAQLEDPSFLDGLTKSLKEASAAAGITVERIVFT